MTRLVRSLFAALLLVSVTACVTTQPRDYSAYRASKPRSILVLPPISNAPDVNASVSMLSVATLPLAEAGYYVIPVAPAFHTFRQNGISVANDAHDIPADRLRDIFGADAALYVTVEKYATVYQVVSSNTTVAAKAKLVDLRTGTLLWEGTALASSAESQSGGGGLIGMLVAAAVNQVLSNVTDEGHRIANVTSLRLLSAGMPNGLLFGPYSPKYGTD